jgi:hypothetical protein
MPGVDLLNQLYTVEKWTDVEAAAKAIVDLVITQGPQSGTFKNVVDSITKACRNKKQKKLKESAVCGLRALFTQLPKGYDAILLQQTTLCLDLMVEPNQDIKSDMNKSLDALFTNLPTQALTTALLPILLEYLQKSFLLSPMP